VVLITGAGGTFKQVLIDSGIGQRLGEAVAATQMPLVLFAFVIAFLVRIAQGSATVAMITAAGLTAPVTLKSWTVATTLMGLTGVSVACLISIFV